jgi:hypothetical protein
LVADVTLEIFSFLSLIFTVKWLLDEPFLLSFLLSVEDLLLLELL